MYRSYSVSFEKSNWYQMTPPTEAVNDFYQPNFSFKFLIPEAFCL
jgi:hypothetical protein